MATVVHFPFSLEVLGEEDIFFTKVSMVKMKAQVILKQASMKS